MFFFSCFRTDECQAAFLLLNQVMAEQANKIVNVFFVESLACAVITRLSNVSITIK